MGSFTSGFLAMATGGLCTGFTEAFTTGAAAGFLVIAAVLETAGLAEEEPALGTIDFGAIPALGVAFTATLVKGFAVGFMVSLTTLTAFAAGFAGVLVFTTVLALTAGLPLFPVMALANGFGLGLLFDLAALAFRTEFPGFFAFTATGLAFGFVFVAEAGLLTVLALATGFGTAFLVTVPFEDFAFTGAGLDDLFF
jgi:hypothetical protein